VPKYFNWLKTEYIVKSKNKTHMEEGSALSTVTGVRSFFKFQREPLQIQDGKLPSTDSIKNKKTDYPFNIYTLRQVFNQGKLEERTVIACGKDLALRVNDFVKLDRETIVLAIQREKNF
jgi:hypothetical protein